MSKQARGESRDGASMREKERGGEWASAKGRGRDDRVGSKCTPLPGWGGRGGGAAAASRFPPVSMCLRLLNRRSSYLVFGERGGVGGEVIAGEEDDVVVHERVVRPPVGGRAVEARREPRLDLADVQTARRLGRAHVDEVQPEALVLLRHPDGALEHSLHRGRGGEDGGHARPAGDDGGGLAGLAALVRGVRVDGVRGCGGGGEGGALRVHAVGAVGGGGLHGGRRGGGRGRRGGEELAVAAARELGGLGQLGAALEGVAVLDVARAAILGTRGREVPLHESHALEGGGRRREEEEEEEIRVRAERSDEVGRGVARRTSGAVGGAWMESGWSVDGAWVERVRSKG